ncbi:hypothetical protein [Streptomyces sp. NPDC048720]|uniref:hypothetical protein n=1 Tax=Streptomyces sp. NPDC048720 TaxID=3365588 RepID=UPI003713CE84
MAQAHLSKTQQAIIMMRFEIAKMKEGEKFYSVKQCCERYGLSDRTIWVALQCMVSEGKLEPVPTVGYFVL